MKISGLGYELAFTGVVFGAFIAILFGVAAINAYDGMPWAVELFHSVTYVLTMLAAMLLAVALIIAGIALDLTKGR